MIIECKSEVLVEPVAQINNIKAPDLSLVTLVMQNKRIFFFERVFSQKKKKKKKTKCF